MLNAKVEIACGFGFEVRIAIGWLALSQRWGAEAFAICRAEHGLSVIGRKSRVTAKGRLTAIITIGIMPDACGERQARDWTQYHLPKATAYVVAGHIWRCAFE